MLTRQDPQFLPLVREKLYVAVLSDVLDEVGGFIDRFVSLPSPEHLDALALWTAHTHAADRWNTVTSPTTGAMSGRTCAVLAPVPMIATRFP